MRKKVLGMALVFVIGTAAAQAQSLAGKGSIEGFGGIGMTYLGGTLAAGESGETATSYSFGALGAYGVSDSVQLFGGAAYAYRPLALSASDADSSEDVTLKYTYIDLLFGARFFISSFYFEAGAYYGIIAGDPEFEAKAAGMTFTGKIKDLGSSTANDYGLVLGLGYLFVVNEKVSLDLGLRAKGGLSDVYKDEVDKIRSRDIAINAGLVYNL